MKPDKNRWEAMPFVIEIIEELVKENPKFLDDLVYDELKRIEKNENN